jgi:hypothetical protein
MYTTDLFESRFQIRLHYAIDVCRDACRAVVLSPARAAAVLVLAGAAVRLQLYLAESSLWFDELMISLNIIHRPISALKPPLDFHQGAPFGFLALERAAVVAFGTGEYALRLVPLISGIAALVGLYGLLQRTMPAGAMLLGLALFALSTIQVGYAAEVKPYSIDTAITAFLLLQAVDAATAPTRRSLLLLAISGAAAVWFSYPAVFVLAGAGTCLAAFAVMEEQWTRVGQLALVGLTWAVSFGVCYLVSIRAINQDQYVFGMWTTAFVPWIGPYWTAGWVLDRLFGLFSNPVGITLTGLGAFAFVAGWLARLDESWRLTRWILISPLLVVLAAAALHRYPFEGRFLNFLVPPILAVVGLGMYQVVMATRRTAPLVGLALVLLLFFHPLWIGTYAVLRPQPNVREDIRPVLEYVREKKHADDALYLYWRAEPAFAYYSERWHDARLDSGVIPKRHWTSADLDDLEMASWEQRSREFLRDLETLRGHPRVWLVFQHVAHGDGWDEEHWFKVHLNQLGTELDHISMTGAAAYLYDLSASSAHTLTTE